MSEGIDWSQAKNYLPEPTQGDRVRVHKPWGWYEDLYREKQVVLKTICINPGQAFSLQYHRKRREIWVVDKGPILTLLGKITEETGDYEYKSFVHETGAVLILPKMALHQAENTNDFPVFITELQTGECDEEDIVRLEDRYGRK